MVADHMGRMFRWPMDMPFRVPSGYVKIAIEHGPFLVELPIENGDFP